MRWEYISFLKKQKVAESVFYDRVYKLLRVLKMPKNRAWYFNKDGGYLGTDVLS
jgi:hypothetical protein